MERADAAVDHTFGCQLNCYVESDDIVKGKSTSNPVIALRDYHKKAQEMS